MENLSLSNAVRYGKVGGGVITEEEMKQKEITS